MALPNLYGSLPLMASTQEDPLELLLRSSAPKPSLAMPTQPGANPNIPVANVPTSQPGVFRKPSSKTVTSSPVFESEDEKAQRLLMAQLQPFVKQQEQGIAEMEKLRQLESQAPVDVLSGPLAALLKAQHGIDTSGFKPGTTPEEQRAKLTAYADKIADQKKSLAQTIMAAAKPEKTGNVTNIIGGGEGGGREDRLARTRLLKDYDSYTKDSRESLELAQQAKASLLSGSLTGQKAFTNFLARASGEKGPLTFSDIQQFSGPPDLKSRLERTFSKATTGELTDSDKDDLVLLIDKYAEYANDKLNRKTKFYVDKRAPYGYGVDSDLAREILMPEGGYGLSKEVLAPKGGDNFGISKEAAIEALNKRKAQKQ